MAADTSAIIAAAGSSSRMGGENKQFLNLCGMPVIARSMLAFQNCEDISEIILVAREEDIPQMEKTAKSSGIKKLSAIVTGGGTRQESVVNGLKAVSKETSMICIHDGARPLIKPELISKTIADARIFGGATLGVPAKDTVKTVNGGLIVDTPDRSKLYLIQTPQAFKKSVYFEGVNFALAHGLDFTDDCQLVESVGIKICLTQGDYKNIKITTPEDIFIARALMEGMGCV
ncbi:MAG TPA: 2-C-methyl-D-erythritol 4-phosphate cytidylyltransferase [Oscillospiraceae bacterium]|nr:2-C-methyl-D-erythritol 4-phosphate cytidylyltransferase [Oscillospiraceae bacterium]